MRPNVRILTSSDTIPADRTIVVIDVIRATTTAITAVAQGRRCLIAADESSVEELVRLVEDPLLCGEISGEMPAGFDLNNSPARLDARTDTNRAVVLLSSTGSPLMRRAAERGGGRAYAASLRNLSAQVRQLAAEARDVILLAGTDKNPDVDLALTPGLRIEDELCCALIAARLLDGGFTSDAQTAAVASRWGEADLNVIKRGRSAAYLARSGQLDDLEFILAHVDDVDAVFTIDDIELLAAAA